jgi:hypothetical protein
MQGDKMTLTRDEILAMTPDQLRVEIARERGYTVCAAKFFDVFELILDGRVLAVSSNKQNAWHNTPNWPTSIADAWELVEEMRPLITVAITASHYGLFNCTFTRRDEYFPFLEIRDAATAPLAISRAWLLWHEERKG